MRSAVGELCVLLIDHAPPRAMLRLSMCSSQERLVVTGALIERTPIPPMDPLSRLLLDGLDLEWTHHPPQCDFQVVAPAWPDRSRT